MSKKTKTYRFAEETLIRVELMRKKLAEETGTEVTSTFAIEYMINFATKKLIKKSE